MNVNVQEPVPFFLPVDYLLFTLFGFKSLESGVAIMLLLPKKMLNFCCSLVVLFLLNI